MTRIASKFLLSCAAAAALGLSAPAHAVHGGEGLKWGDAPPVLPRGAKLAVLKGDPSKPGPYVMRLSLPAGYRIAPHSHSKAENVTVLSGAFMVGMGEKYDPKAMNTMKAGAFGSIDANAPHYAMAKTATVLQIHGEGPFDMVYVNPQDAPAQARQQ